MGSKHDARGPHSSRKTKHYLEPNLGCNLRPITFRRIPTALPSFMTFSATPRTLISISVVVLATAAVFGVFNATKIKTLRSSPAESIAARYAARRHRPTAGQE